MLFSNVVTGAKSLYANVRAIRTGTTYHMYMYNGFEKIIFMKNENKKIKHSIVLKKSKKI